jgi:hypothetical protein
MLKTLSRLTVVFSVLSVFAAGCANNDVTKVPPGTEVEVTKQDGGVVHGKVARVDGQNAVIAVGSRERIVAASDVAALRVIDAKDAAKDTPLPAVAKFREYTVPDGTKLTVRLETAVASDTSRVEDPIDARLVEPVSVDGREVLPVGAMLKGVVSEVQASGKVKGRASLGLRFTSIASDGETYAISGHIGAEAPSTKQKDAEKIGIPAVGGAIIGAIIGGKKGAAIGAVVGGGAGTAVVLTTPGEEIRWPRGTNVAFALGRDVDVKLPIRRNQ